jgi:ATP-binding cassette, subfamily B, bacterial
MTGRAAGRRENSERARTASLAGPALAAFALVWAASPFLTIAIAVTTLTTGFLPASVAVLQRGLLDALVVHTANTGQVVLYAAELVGAGILVAVIPDLTTYIQAQLSRVVSVRSADRLFRVLNAIPGIARFESPQFIDSVQMAKGVGQPSSTSVITSAFSSLQAMVTACSLAIAVWTISPVLVGVVLLAASPGVVADLYLGGQSADLQWRQTRSSRRQMFYSSLQSDLHAAKEIRLFGIGDFLRIRMLKELLSINARQRKLSRKYLIIQFGVGLFGSVVMGGGLLWTVHQAALGAMPIGDVSLFVLAAAGVQGAVGSAITSIAGGYQSLLLFRHYVDVVSAGSDLPVPDRPLTVTGLSDGIEVRDVWFRYGPVSPWVLQGVNLTIPAAATVGLVGVNGAGKSTLVKLLCRFYDPQVGGIFWDGVDIKEIDPMLLRQRIGAIFQDYMAYDLTARENIGLGDVERIADDASIQAAAQLAGVHQAVELLPEQYDTMLSRIFFNNRDKNDPRTGVVLSGGQWQRLALARGLMRADRDLMILDEPTAGLDAEAEYRLSSRLSEARQGRSCLLISHRLATLREADVIYVLADGIVTERGDHAELIRQDGDYARLFKLQASGYQEDVATASRESTPALTNESSA